MWGVVDVQELLREESRVVGKGKRLTSVARLGVNKGKKCSYQHKKEFTYTAPYR